MFRFLTGVAVAGLALAALVLDEESEKEIKVGDMIQWEINGSYQFKEPKKVQKIENSDEGVPYLLVEGQATGVPASQATKI